MVSPHLKGRNSEQDFINQFVVGDSSVLEGGDRTHKPGQTLGNYQEIRIRHFENTVDKYVNS